MDTDSTDSQKTMEQCPGGKHKEITERIIDAAYRVHNALGFGFLEKVYENALAIEMRRCGLTLVQQQPISVRYEGEVVGEYVADMVVEGKVIVEVKAVSDLTQAHEVQLVNYLKATGMSVGPLINFGRSVKVKRKSFGP